MVLKTLKPEIDQQFAGALALLAAACVRYPAHAEHDVVEVALPRQERPAVVLEDNRNARCRASERHPEKLIEPPLVGTNPARHISSVVFPHPDGPTIEMNSPSCTLKSISAMIGNVVAPSPIDLAKWLTDRTGCGSSLG